jgi:hypothetical protein
MTAEEATVPPLCPTCPHRHADAPTEALAETPADAPAIMRVMPDWIHTHDLSYRRRVWPVMSKTYMGMMLMFRADGMVEWLRHPTSGWAFRGERRSAVALRSVLFGKKERAHVLELGPAPSATPPSEPRRD